MVRSRMVSFVFFVVCATIFSICNFNLVYASSITNCIYDGTSNQESLYDETVFGKDVFDESIYDESTGNDVFAGKSSIYDKLTKIETDDLILEPLKPISEENYRKLKWIDEKGKKKIADKRVNELEKIENDNSVIYYSELVSILNKCFKSLGKLSVLDVGLSYYQRYDQALEAIVFGSRLGELDLLEKTRKAGELGCEGWNYVLCDKNKAGQPVIGLVSASFYYYDGQGADDKIAAHLSVFVDPDYQKKGLGEQALTIVAEKVLGIADVSRIYYSGLEADGVSSKISDKVFGNIAKKNEKLFQRRARQYSKLENWTMFTDMIEKK